MRVLILLVTLLAAGAAHAVDLNTLSPWEAARWKLVKDDPKLAPAFHATRDYVHLCRRIVDGKAPYTDLKRPKEFDSRFLENADVAMINKAVDLSLDALADELINEKPGAAVPAAPVPALDSKDMTKWEAARWAELKDDKAAKDAFLATRGYVHLAQKILDGKTPSSELKRPKNFDAKHLAAGDVEIINKAIDKGLDDLAKP